MGNVKYIVKARDNAGHQFKHTYLYSSSASTLASVHGPAEGVAFMQTVVQSYEDEILDAAPFQCVGCGRLATSLFHMPTAHMEPADPVIFDVPLPYCGSSSCESTTMRRQSEAARNLGQGSKFSQAASSCGGPPSRQHKDLNHLAHKKVTACVICADTVGLQMCGRCKIVPYCSVYCQKRHYAVHKGVCKATARSL